VRQPVPTRPALVRVHDQAHHASSGRPPADPPDAEEEPALAIDLTRDYPAYPEDERSERAREVGFEGRYRGNRIMLLRSGPPADRVVRIQKISGGGPDGPGYFAETLAGACVEVREAEVVLPDPGPLVAALTRRRGEPWEADDATVAALVSGYVWMSWSGLPGLSQGNADAAVWAFVQQAEAGTAWEPDDAVAVWSTREGCARAPGPGAAVARLPFVAACRVAAGRHVAVDQGLPTAVVVPARDASLVAATLDPAARPREDGSAGGGPTARSRLGRLFGRP
jgi:hypothetical protein